jgi:hypothetical protein
MSEWFVHVDVSYYPSAHVVEAPSREEAVELVKEDHLVGGEKGRAAFYAVPFDAEAASGAEWRMKDWRDV